MKRAALNRLREPSTWTAIATLGLLFGAKPEHLDAFVQAGIAAAAVAGVLLPERRADPQPPTEE